MNLVVVNTCTPLHWIGIRSFPLGNCKLEYKWNQDVFVRVNVLHTNIDELIKCIRYTYRGTFQFISIQLCIEQSPRLLMQIEYSQAHSVIFCAIRIVEDLVKRSNKNNKNADRYAFCVYLQKLNTFWYGIYVCTRWSKISSVC